MTVYVPVPMSVAALRTKAWPAASIDARASHGAWNQKKLTPAMP